MSQEPDFPADFEARVKQEIDVIVQYLLQKNEDLTPEIVNKALWRFQVERAGRYIERYIAKVDP